MTNGRKPQLPSIPIPRTGNLPPTSHNMAPLVEEYSQEAARAAQRFFDMTTELTRLQHEMEEWRGRATMAEEECKRSEVREQRLGEKLERTSERLTAERDRYRDRLTALKAEFAVAGNVILGCMKTAEDLMQPRADLERLASVEGALSAMGNPPLPPEDPLPKVVTDGPRED